MEDSEIPIIRLFHVYKSYGEQKSLIDVTVDIYKREIVIVTGPSGAGKSTLLKLLYREEVATQGQIIIDGVNIDRIRNRRLPFFRRNIGIVFQDYRLLPRKTVFENVALVLEAAGEKQRLVKKRVCSVLRNVGMEDRQQAFPPSLSGGEQQRVAIARAIVGSPKILLADEPTGSLDPDSAETIVALLREVHQRGVTVIIATHDRMITEKTDGRIIRLYRGCVNDDSAIQTGVQRF